MTDVSRDTEETKPIIWVSKGKIPITYVMGCPQVTEELIEIRPIWKKLKEDGLCYWFDWPWSEDSVEESEAYYTCLSIYENTLIDNKMRFYPYKHYYCFEEVDRNNPNQKQEVINKFQLSFNAAYEKLIKKEKGESNE